MKYPEHVLSLITDDSGQAFLHADEKGLDILMAALQRLRGKIKEGKCDHDHLMTVAWAGDGELTEAKGCEREGQTVHHLKLYGWTDDWAKKHGFLK